jgi:hypothetical protein
MILNTADEKDLLAEQEPGPAIEAGERILVQPSCVVLLGRIEPKDGIANHSS